MSVSTTLLFRLPEGWTLRKVATAMAKEWLPPFRAEPTFRAARWVVQSVMEETGNGEAPLWEPGISTEEYEARLDRADLSWVIRASAGRGKGTILARFAMSKGLPDTFQVECLQATFPETLFDAEKLEQFLESQGAAGAGGLFAALLISNGFEPIGD